MTIQYQYTDGPLSVDVIIETYDVERWSPHNGFEYSVECYYVEDIIHKGESIINLVSEGICQDILDSFKKEKANNVID